MLNTHEHYELMEQFEKEHRHLRLDREPKDLWSRGIIYGSGEANNLFLAYRRGYALGKAVSRGDAE